MRAQDLISPPDPCRRLTLRHGKLYMLTLKQHDILMTVTAYNLHPRHYEWQFIESVGSCPAGAMPAHLVLARRHALEPVEDFDLDQSGRYDAVLDDDPTGRDLVPADDLARELWRAQFGHPAVCPRCDAEDDQVHHPLCHDADGVPLFPDYSRDHWLDEVRDQCANWEEEIGLDT